MVMQYKAGLGNVGSYQVSGKPWAKGGINAGSVTSVSFPAITRWVQVNNNTGNVCKVGFSSNGIQDDKYFTVASGSTSGPLELKLTQLWLHGSTNVDVVVGLTFIEKENINNTAVSPKGSNINWTGSAGV
tara:strand:+ start:784 stop:1173 length:390 start_codon:yes stop_codon:yes gene_type:complete